MAMDELAAGVVTLRLGLPVALLPTTGEPNPEAPRKTMTPISRFPVLDVSVYVTDPVVAAVEVQVETLVYEVVVEFDRAVNDCDVAVGVLKVTRLASAPTPHTRT